MPIRIVAIKATGPVIPRSKMVDAMKRAVVNQQADGVRYMAEYPPQPPNSHYKRTGTLKRSWHAPPVQVQPGTISGEITSQGQIAPYNEKVQGESQEAFFAGRGWRGVEALVKRVQREFPKRVQAAVNQGAKP